MSIYDEKPWLSRYDPDQQAEISPEFTDALRRELRARA